MQARRLLKHASETLQGIRQNDNIASLHLTILENEIFEYFRSLSISLSISLSSLLSYLKDNSHGLGELHCIALQKCSFSCVWVWERARERRIGRGSGEGRTNRHRQTVRYLSFFYTSKRESNAARAFDACCSLMRLSASACHWAERFIIIFSQVEGGIKQKRKWIRMTYLTALLACCICVLITGARRAVGETPQRSCWLASGDAGAHANASETHPSSASAKRAWDQANNNSVLHVFSEEVSTRKHSIAVG